MFEWLNSLGSIKDIEYAVGCIDLKTGESYLHNGASIIPSASTIKLPIMAAAFKLMEEKKLDPKQRMTVKNTDKIDFSILTLLDDKNSYTLLDVIILMIIQSDNTATNMLIDLIGMEQVNRYIAQIGLQDTVLQRKMLDFAAKRMGRDNLTTAKDMARFMKLLYEGRLAGEQETRMMLEILKNQLDRSSLYQRIPDETIIAHKSGQLDKSEHEVGILYAGRSDIAFSIMTWNAASNNLARQTIGNIAWEIFDHFR